MTTRRGWTPAAIALILFAPVVAAAGWSAGAGAGLESLALSSERVVRATVIGRTSGWDPSHRWILTHVSLRPVETLWGPVTSIPIELQLFGGTVGDTTLLASGLPRFEDEEEVVLFLTRSGGYTLVAGGESGKLRIERDAQGIEWVGSGSPMTGRVGALRWNRGEPALRITYAELRTRLARAMPEP